MTPEARDKAIREALSAADRDPRAERQTIPWKGGTEACTVVEVDVDVVLLNPQSHRIKAQLESHPKRQQVQASPWSPEAQHVLAELLRATAGFEDISASLREDGQLEPGVVTRAGVLVNANTRCVALRDLGEKYIKAMVLPEGATYSEISELELRLQVRPDLRQDYSFTNELLFIEDCINTGWPPKRVSKELGYTSAEGEKKGVEQVRHQLRMLATIQELREMSNNRLSYETFDEMKQAMIDLDGAYEKLRKQDTAAAERLRQARIIGILSGMFYRDLRNVDEEFIDSYLGPELEDSAELRPYIPEFKSSSRASEIPGQDLLGDPDNSEDLGAGLLDWLTSTAGHTTVSVGARSSKITEPRAEVVDAIRDAMGSAAEAARADRSREDLVERPAKRLKEARQKVQAARDAVKKSKGDARLADQVGRIAYEISKLRRDVDTLQSSLDEAAPSQGG